jgi:hypothetical protein
LIDSNASPKVKTKEERQVGVHSFTRNILGIGGRARTLRWGLG